MKYKKILAYDLETTGLYPAQSKILELAFISVDIETKKETRFSSLIFQKEAIPKHITGITGISKSTLLNEGCKPISEVMELFKKQQTHDTLYVGHNIVKFDNNFIKVFAGWEIDPNNCFDTLLQAKFDTLAKKGSNWRRNQLSMRDTILRTKTSLGAMAKKHRIKSNGNLHRALSDAHISLELFKIQSRKIRDFASVFVKQC